MGQISSFEKTDLKEENNPTWPDLSYEEMFTDRLNMEPIIRINSESKLDSNIPILSLYLSDKELYIFVYKGKSKWHVYISNNSSGGGDDVVNGDEFPRTERNEFIFSEIMKFFENLEFSYAYHNLGSVVRAFELFQNFIKRNFKDEERNKKMEEYFKAKQILMEKALNLIKNN